MALAEETAERTWAATERACAEAALGASEDISRGLVKLYELDGVFGIVALAARRGVDELQLTQAYVRLGEVLGLDWAQSQALRDSGRAAAAGARAKEEFLASMSHATRAPGCRPAAGAAAYKAHQADCVIGFGGGTATIPMLAQIAGQARILLAR